MQFVFGGQRSWQQHILPLLWRGNCHVVCLETCLGTVRNFLLSFAIAEIHLFLACLGITYTSCSLLGCSLSPTAWWNIVVCVWVGIIGTKSTYTWFSRDLWRKGKFNFWIAYSYSSTYAKDRSQSVSYFVMYINLKYLKVGSIGNILC
jgi:hypothetical protein